MSGSPEGIYEPGIVDPGVPVPHPTQSFWLSSPHPLANHQSPWPTDAVDVAIIGSGITGTNIARTLLHKQPNLRIVVLEARSLCSGATGRNGGHIKTMSFASWEQRKAAYGVEEAVRITAFEHSHLDAMTEAARGIDCDLVRTEGVDAYFDQKTFDRALAALEDMRAHAPELAAQYTVYTSADRLQRVMKLSPRCVGAMGVPAASLWPYRLVTGLMGRMIESGKLNVQTHTAVTSIDDDNNTDFALVLSTRGTVRARHVVHATNGWLGYLLPELRPFVSPVRGNVVRYAPSSCSSTSTSAETNATSASPFALSPSFSFWLRYATHDYDYLIQRASDNSIVVGRANTGRRATADDSETDLAPMAHLRGFAGEVLAAPTSSPAAATTIVHAWSGILAFVQDASPFVGPLRPGNKRGRQWVCGAYHGIGMIKAFRAAEMVAGMLLGEELADEYPRSMLITEERLWRLRASLEECGAGLEKPRL